MSGEHVSWVARAASLTERRAALAAGGGAARVAAGGVDPSATESIGQRWRARVATGDDDRFTARLAALGLRPDDVAGLATVVAATPSWAAMVPPVAARCQQLANTLAGEPDEMGEPAFDHEWWQRDAHVPFAALWAPWVSELADLLASLLDDNGVPGRGPLVQLHWSRLANIGARAAHAHLTACAPAAPGERGYRQWAHGLLADGCEPLFRAYPVLGRLLAVATEQANGAAGEVGHRLHADRELLRDHFGLPVADELVRATAMGDLHHDGRQVLLLAFAGGAQVIYKPRSLQPELLFAAAAAHVARFGGLDCELTPPMIDRGDYGWCDFVESRAPGDLAELHTYSRRAGAMAALAVATSTNDLHIDNLLVVGDRPVLCDLECIASPPLARADEFSPDVAPLHHSVLGTYLLPLTHREEALATDNSGLTGVLGRLSGATGRRWTQLGTAEIGVERTLHRNGGSSARPSNPALPLLDIEHFEAGFRGAAAVIERRGVGGRGVGGRGVGLHEAAPLRHRVVLRDTQTYGTVMAQAMAPEHLVDGLRFSIELDALAAGAFDDDAPTWRAASADAERECMERMDFPLAAADWHTGRVMMATGRAGSGDAGAAGTAGTVVELDGVLVRSGLEQVRAQRRLLHSDRVHLQLGLCRIALEGRLGVHRPPAHGRSSAVAVHPVAGNAPTGLPPVDELCAAIGEHLLATAITVADGSVQWLTVDPRRDGAMVPRLGGAGLYSGSAGVAVFLAALARRSGSAAVAELAVRALGRGQAGAVAAGPSLASGVAGWAYAAVLAGRLLGDEVLVKEAVLALTDAATAESLTRELDLMAGQTGVLAVAAMVAATTGDDALATASCGLADRVVQEWAARRSGSWVERNRLECIGLAHGITGTNLALARAAQVAAQPRTLDLLAELVGIENERVARRGGVPSRVSSGAERAPEASWCWGTTGFALAREVVAGVLPGAEATRFLPEARHLCGTLPSPLHRFCCGSAGTLDALAPGGQAHTDAVRDLVAHRGHHLLEPQTTFAVPSLFRGEAGVGYALLRATEPSLPCVGALAV